MNVVSHVDVAGAARGVAAIFSFRSLPMVGALLLAPGARAGVRVSAAAVYAAAAIALGAWTGATIGVLLAAYAYFALAGACAPEVARALRAGNTTRFGVLAAATFAFLVAPALLLPEAGRATVLVIGWDLVLSSYSYCVEVAEGTKGPAIGDCLFFLLVNPALVYSNRGRPVSAPGFDFRAVLRAVLGMLTIFIGLALIAPACAAAEEQRQLAVHPWPVDAALFGALRLLLEYARQSGLASLQIGMIRQLGYEIPERFHFPFLARDPMDFWRRWNTYVGGWLLRYVFRPVAARYRGYGVTWRLPVAQTLGIVAAFSVTGLLHDAFAYAATLDLGWAMSEAFLVVGAIAAAWALGGRLVRRRAPDAGLRGRWRGAAVASRAAFWVIATGCVAWGWR
jgi:hypothetical protein